MKVIRERINRKGKREVTIELDDSEQIHAIRPDGFYMTGYPVEEVLQGHIILASESVAWCPVGQEWVS